MTPRNAVSYVLGGPVLSVLLFLPVAGWGQNTAASASATPPPANAKTVEDILVRVNDQIISSTDVQRAETALEQEARERNVSAAELESRRKDLLRDQIDQQLLLSKGKELGITGDTELIKRLDEIRKQNHFESLDDLEKAAKEQGVSYEDFKASLRNTIITQSVIRQEVGRHINVSASDLRHYYDAHKADFSAPESVHLAEILLPTPSDVGPARDMVQHKAEALATELKAGGDFAAGAKANSAGPTAAQGGDLGTFKRGALAKELEDQVFPLPVGGVSSAILTKQGYIILKVLEHNAGGAQPYEAVQPDVEEAVYTERMQPAIRQYLRRLREESYIDIKPGYVDSGASPNETKPVYSAYAPPAAKKKKAVVQKVRYTGKARYSQRPKPESTAVAPTTVSATEAGAKALAQGQSAPPATNSGASAPGSAAPANATPAQTATAKPHKTKREKIRFGKLPRQSLPEAPDQSTQQEGADAGAVGAPTASPDAAQPSQVAAAGDVPAPTGPKPVKTRFSARAKLPKEQQQRLAAVGSDLTADPDAPPVEEVAGKKTQYAPLGLSGDTKAKKKQKKEKGAAKTRYSEKTPPAKTDQQPDTNPQPAPSVETGQPQPSVNGQPSPPAAPAQTQPPQSE
jgi:peptidyl-prolyl cis-trans isomerase SurA